MAASATLKVLRAAIGLGEFTQPELAAISGASYETVKKVLRAERDDRTVEQLDQTIGGAKGRPRVVWRVIDRAAIEARLDAGRREAEDIAETLSTSGEVPPMYSPLDAALSAAEDRLVLALKAGEPGDAASFARDALAELEPFREDLKADDGGRSGRRKRNVGIPVGRAEVVRALAACLAGDDNRGTQGASWWGAYDAIHAFDHAPQAALHKTYLTGLVDLVDHRAT
jgi:hypothetical protein